MYRKWRVESDRKRGKYTCLFKSMYFTINIIILLYPALMKMPIRVWYYMCPCVRYYIHIMHAMPCELLRTMMYGIEIVWFELFLQLQSLRPWQCSHITFFARDTYLIWISEYRCNACRNYLLVHSIEIYLRYMHCIR